MALRTIVKDGDPILKKVCRPVTKFDDRLATLKMPPPITKILLLSSSTPKLNT